MAEFAHTKIPNMINDYFIEDITKNIERKKKLDSKDKGQRGERELCKILAKRFAGRKGFYRVVGSGSRGKQVQLSEQDEIFFAGDIVAPAGFVFSIECKYGYADIDLGSALEGGSKDLDRFLNQAEKDASRVGKMPMLCWKKPRKNWLVFLKESDISGDFTYKFIYRDWVIVALTDILLKLEDSFFFR